MTSPTNPTPLDLLLRGDAASPAAIIGAAALASLLIPETCDCSTRVHCSEHGDSQHVHPHPGMAAAYDRGDSGYPGCRACACEDYCRDALDLAVHGHGCDECMGPPDDDDGHYTIQGEA
jgi:hypothetical protein